MMMMQPIDGGGVLSPPPIYNEHPGWNYNSKAADRVRYRLSHGIVVNQRADGGAKYRSTQDSTPFITIEGVSPFILYGIIGSICLLLITNILCLCCFHCCKHKYSKQKMVYPSDDDMEVLNEVAV